MAQRPACRVVHEAHRGDGCAEHQQRGDGHPPTEIERVQTLRNATNSVRTWRSTSANSSVRLRWQVSGYPTCRQSDNCWTSARAAVGAAPGVVDVEVGH